MPRGRQRAAFLRLVACSTLAAATAVGCGEVTPGERALRGLPEFCREVLPAVDRYLAEHPAPQGERYGGTVVVGAIGELLDGMNAVVSADHWAHQHQTFMNLMTLIQVDEDLEPRPYLARSWELNPDNTELTFRLRDDVRWHDGTPTTAHDVAFTFLRATDPETAFPNAAFWEHYVPGPEGVEVLDDHTVRFHLRPHAELLDPWRALAIMPRHLLADVPPAELRHHPYGTRCPVGNGPFVFEGHTPDASWSFARNPAFPDELGGPPYLDRYVYRIVPEQTTLLTELLTEGVDAYYSPLPDQVSRIEGEDGLVLHDFDFRTYIFIAWNSRRPVLAEAPVRRAISMGTDRRRIVDALLAGYGEVAHAGVPPFHWAYHDGLDESLPHDPEGARALLDEAGWMDRNGDGIREDEEGTPLEISIKYNTGHQQRQEISEIMQAQLREIGIRVRPQAVEWPTLVDQFNTPGVRDFDGVVLGFVTDFRIDDHDLFHSAKQDQPYGWAGIAHDRLDQLLDTLQLVVDRDEAIPLWHEYQELVVELQPFTYFAFPRRLVGMNRRVRDVEMDVRGELVSVARWWIPEEERRRSR